MSRLCPTVDSSLLPKRNQQIGSKLFVLTDSKGIVYDFDIYYGRMKAVNGLLDIRASGNVAVDLYCAKNENLKVIL